MIFVLLIVMALLYKDQEIPAVDGGKHTMKWTL